MNEITEYSIKDWVNEASDDRNQEFREAVHTVLSAIANDSDLKANMILKGGILLAIRYKSHRFTKDIDFSTHHKLGEEVTLESICESLNHSMSQMVEVLEYGLDCRIQSSQIQPKATDATYPSIKLKIGYAYKGSNKHVRLESLKCPDVISIDYSLNEATPNVEQIKLESEDNVLAYTLVDLIAEKYRSYLQQAVRNRNRRQDVYDLSILINQLDSIDNVEKSQILASLIEKSNARGIDPTIDSFNNSELKERAQREYLTLADEVDGTLPDFDDIWVEARDFYQSLPWNGQTK